MVRASPANTLYTRITYIIYLIRYVIYYTKNFHTVQSFSFHSVPFTFHICIPSVLHVMHIIFRICIMNSMFSNWWPYLLIPSSFPLHPVSTGSHSVIVLYILPSFVFLRWPNHVILFYSITSTTMFPISIKRQTVPLVLFPTLSSLQLQFLLCQ